MWCPKCKNEYVDGVVTCVDCGCDLVKELPKEIDENEPQVIGSVKDEKTGHIFLQFFRYSGFETCGLMPHENDDEFYLVVANRELEPIMEVIRKFADLEEGTQPDLEELASVLNEKLDSLQEEEANEMLSDLRTETSSVYVKKRDKYADFRFSGYSFIVFALIGYACCIANLTGIISIFNAYTLCVMAVIFTIFLGIGISSLRKAQKIKTLVSEEESLLEKVENYIENEFTDEYITSLQEREAATLEGLSEEEIFLHITELLKRELVEQFPLFSKDYIDQLVDERYDNYCDSKQE